MGIVGIKIGGKVGKNIGGRKVGEGTGGEENWAKWVTDDIHWILLCGDGFSRVDS